MSDTSDVALSWLTLKTLAAGGAMQFCVTENGDVGLFEDGVEKALGVGETADEALHWAHDAYHKTPGLEECHCEILEEHGDVLP